MADVNFKQVPIFWGLWKEEGMQEKKFPHQIVDRQTGVIYLWKDQSAKREARGHGFSGKLSL